MSVLLRPEFLAEDFLPLTLASFLFLPIFPRWTLFSACPHRFFSQQPRKSHPKIRTLQMGSEVQKDRGGDLPVVTQQAPLRSSRKGSLPAPSFCSLSWE